MFPSYYYTANLRKKQEGKIKFSDFTRLFHLMPSEKPNAQTWNTSCAFSPAKKQMKKKGLLFGSTDDVLLQTPPPVEVCIQLYR